VPSPRTQAEALVVLTWNQESVILSDSAKKQAKYSLLALILSIISQSFFYQLIFSSLSLIIAIISG
jgi:hypothetical protein